ncbi:unnamed protein product [Mytilus edulis]|uniref:YqaJ viral recombinase domain-containing protein n=1 Tax=Mytilus edulis TaxID=6550 RepID=A0A8S3RX65_MYTED|nr:unnamed protein product [Mytilus edulis]
MEFCCQYCELYNLDIFSILGHTILNHGDRFLSVKRKTTKDGVTGYVSKHYHIIPEILKSENKKIWISPGDEKIKISEVCSEKAIENFSITEVCSEKSNENFSKSDDYDLRMEDDSNKDNEFQGKCKQPHEINLATVLNKIPNNDSQRDNFWLFIHLTLQDRFPMQSIAFLLFLDVVRWFSESKISAMRYSDRSKSFWQIGFRLFHTKFLNFMRGLGNQNLVMENIGIREKFDPENSKINFAVPSKASLSCMPTVLPKTIQPGIIKELISFISTTDDVTTKSWKICVDLKKINSGRGGDSIPVDLWGYEDKPNRLEKQTELEADLQVIQCITERINSLIALEHESLSILRDNEQIKSFAAVSRWKRSKSEKIMEKSEKQSPGDWKKSKYAYAISAMKTNIGMTKDCIDSLLRVNDRICKYFSYMNGSETSFVIGKEADMNNQPNYFCLRSEFYKETNSQCTKFLQQRSDEWFELRKQAKVTASTMHTALGLRTLKEQQAHYDSVILNKDKDGVQSPTPQMLHGIENEKHGVATICGKILPSLFPKIKFKEVGCYVKWREDKPFLVASPDGEGDEGQMKRFLFEIKCPYKSDWKTNVSYSIPNYYVLQLITQMGASKESYGYRGRISVWNAQQKTYQKKPKTKELKALIDTFLTQNVKYLGEFKSLKAIQCRHDSAQTDGVYGSHSPSTEQRRTFNAIDLSEIKSCIDDVKCLINQHFTLCFDRPSDVMVFMLSDLDRTYAIDKPYVFPVAYGLSPKHLKADTVRQMLEFLREQLKTYNIHVQVEAFDGQFSKLSIVSYDGSSLSELQERKMHWKETCAKSSHELLRPFLQLGNVCGPVKTFDDINEKWKLTINYRTDNHGNLLHGPITCNTCYLKLSSSEEQNVWREVFEKPSNFKTNTKSKNDNTENNACKDYDENNIQNLSLPDEITIPHISNNNYQTMLEYLTKTQKQNVRNYGN